MHPIRKTRKVYAKMSSDKDSGDERRTKNKKYKSVNVFIQKKSETGLLA